MSASNDGGPAFPVPFGRDADQPDVNGMSLRDWFAGQALTGQISIAIPMAIEARIPASESIKMIAKGCYEIADAMLQARADCRANQKPDGSGEGD